MNGFAVDGYLPFWGPLCDRFEIAAFDFRNHGQNPVATSGLPGHSYAQMTLDLNTVFREITDRLGKKTSIGIFHSMSGRTAMKHACEIGFVWDALNFDPPNVPLRAIENTIAWMSLSNLSAGRYRPFKFGDLWNLLNSIRTTEPTQAGLRALTS